MSAADCSPNASDKSHPRLPSEVGDHAGLLVMGGPIAFTKDEPRLLTDLDRQFAENYQALVRGWVALAHSA
jgi:hypothetical protein